MENKNHEQIEEIFEIFKTPEYQKKVEERRYTDQRKEELYNVVATANKNRGVYEACVKNNTTEKVQNKSVGSHKKVKDTNRRQRPFKKFLLQQKIAIIMCSIACVVAIGSTAYAIKGEEWKQNYETRQEIKAGSEEAEALLLAEAEHKLEIYGLKGQDLETGETVIKNNDVEDYAKLNSHSKLDVYIYSQILPREELQKYIQSVSYNNGLNTYINFTQFLNINGYYENGEPSEKVFKNYMEAYIKEHYESILARYNYEDGILTIEDMLEKEETQGRGAK